MWVYYRLESQTQAGKDSHVWGGVIWLHSQNTWQVHIYISLPVGEANNSYSLLSAYMCQKPFSRVIQVPIWASQPSIISSILQMRRLRPRQVMETFQRPIVAKWRSWHWNPSHITKHFPEDFWENLWRCEHWWIANSSILGLVGGMA